MSKSNEEISLGEGAAMAAGLIAIIAVAWFLVWAIMDHQDYLNDQQKKQDSCLKAGGMWIDNRNTEGYCFFNK